MAPRKDNGGETTELPKYPETLYPKVRHVYAAIAAIVGEFSTNGIAKSRENEGQSFKFRGIDDVFNALAPKLAEHKLLILPRMVGRTVAERQTRNGGALFYVTVEAEFDFVSAQDGSTHTVRTFGEAMDSGDKATNKAMSAAYKYAAFQAFCIPVPGDNDADLTTHEVASEPSLPAGYDAFRNELRQAKTEPELRRAFASGTHEQRAWLTTQDAEQWARLKASVGA